MVTHTQAGISSRDYKRYLKSKAWKFKRRRLIEKRGRKCEQCGAKHSLQVHHLTYDRWRNERDEDLRVLCQSCHTVAHDYPTGYAPVLPNDDVWEQHNGQLLRGILLSRPDLAK